MNKISVRCRVEELLSNLCQKLEVLSGREYCKRRYVLSFLRAVEIQPGPSESFSVMPQISHPILWEGMVCTGQQLVIRSSLTSCPWKKQALSFSYSLHIFTDTLIIISLYLSFAVNHSICEKGIIINLHIRELLRNKLTIIYEKYSQRKDEQPSKKHRKLRFSITRAEFKWFSGLWRK